MAKKKKFPILALKPMFQMILRKRQSQVRSV